MQYYGYDVKSLNEMADNNPKRLMDQQLEYLLNTTRKSTAIKDGHNYVQWRNADLTYMPPLGKMYFLDYLKHEKDTPNETMYNLTAQFYAMYVRSGAYDKKDPIEIQLEKLNETKKARNKLAEKWQAKKWEDIFK